MSSPWPSLANIIDQITIQVRLLEADRDLPEPNNLRARLEAIRNFATHGLSVLDEGRVEKHSASVE